MRPAMCFVCLYNAWNWQTMLGFRLGLVVSDTQIAGEVTGFALSISGITEVK
jgi:hypothetical protein